MFDDDISDISTLVSLISVSNQSSNDKVITLYRIIVVKPVIKVTLMAR